MGDNMYHLTKKIKDDFEKREELFLKLIKNNYSKNIIFNNITEIKELVFSNSSKNINLGTSLRNMLAAVSIIGCEYNLHILSEVSGEGCFRLELSKFETDLIKLIILSARGAINHKVYVKIAIKNNGLLVNIKYKIKALPNDFDRANLTYAIKLNGCSNGETIGFNDYLINRLSTVNLTFIDLLG